MIPELNPPQPQNGSKKELMSFWYSMVVSVVFGVTLGRLWFLGYHASVIGLCIGCLVACVQLMVAQLSELIEEAILAHDRRQAAVPEGESR